jgi:NADPH:quinone reductase-like Zn-dependent oxidoreductase
MMISLIDLHDLIFHCSLKEELQMRLYRLPKTDGIDDLTLLEEDTPSPGRGQVLIRMRAASLNYRDLMVATGRFSQGAAAGSLIPMSDGAGEIAAIGADVDGFTVGDRVAPIFMQAWLGGELEERFNTTALGGNIDGVLTEYRVLDQQGVVHIPSHLSYEEASTLPCAALTAWNSLYGSASLKSGETVLALGTGGVSIFALQLARAAGANVIITSSSDEKLARAKALGATHGVNYTSIPDWHKAVLELTDGRGADHVIEVGGAGTLMKSAAAARFGGSISLIGSSFASGDVDPAPIMRRALRLRGVRIGSREMFEAMNRTFAQHALRPVIDKTFAFEDAADAYRHLKSQKHLGKVVISIG